MFVCMCCMSQCMVMHKEAETEGGRGEKEVIGSTRVSHMWLNFNQNTH